MADIVILGIFVADAAYRADRMPKVGETLIGTGFQLGPGGKGSNQAVAAAKAKAKDTGDVTLITRIGQDTFGNMGRDVWAKAGVTPVLIEDHDDPTGSAGIFVDAKTGHNSIVVVPGAAGAITSDDINNHAQTLRGAKVAMTQLEQPVDAAVTFLHLAQEAGATTILNPAPFTDLPAEMPTLCDYITPNETEATEMSGLPVTTLSEAEAAAKALWNKGYSKTIITMGEAGSLYYDGSRTIHTPAVSVGPVVDTTGAGDAFNGGLAVGLAEGYSIRNALYLASVVAGHSVTKHGTAASMPTRDEIAALLP